MITRQFPLDFTLDYPLDIEYGTSKIAFFDIETTGFVAETTYLYLIGCIYLKNTSLHMIQWFSEDIREEALLIESFFDFIKDYDLLIHYNGLGFDIPYLSKKIEILQLDYSLKDIQSLDYYKKISPIRKIFKLDNYKQKTIEAFLKVKREDTFGGGELIEVYQSYLGKKQIENLKKSRAHISNDLASIDKVSDADKLLNSLLLHNEDDLKGLVQISPILYYCDLFIKPFQIIQAGVDDKKLIIRLEYDFNFPIRVNFGNDFIYISAYENSALITIDIYEGELKFFYDNYRDYYYLPDEDRAIHKSLAIYVDKDYRVKAKPSNSYTKKEGLFAPQYHALISPYFKKEYNDKITFVEIHTDFLLQEQNLTDYIRHILSHTI
ncbi:MAG: exonuclease [Anaerolineaceae bacterium]|nr:MAG: exonuclease [Anaerolineaceae bacterium]